jgi:hypothetical protein
MTKCSQGTGLDPASQGGIDLVAMLISDRNSLLN